MKILMTLLLSLAAGEPGIPAEVSETESDTDADRESAERMAFECLSSDRRFDCLLEKGFSCSPVGEFQRNAYRCSAAVGDGCYTKRFRLSGSGWSSSDSWQAGACDAVDTPVPEPGIRWRYDDTNAPVELVFELFVRNVFARTLDHHGSLDALSDNPDHVVFHYVEAGLTGKMDPVDVVRYFAERYLGIEKEVEALSRQLLCDGSRPRYDGEENFLIFNQFDEVRLHVYERHLFLARAELQASGLFDIDKALREYPGAFSSTSTDHKVARAGSIAKIYEHASLLCEKPWGQSFYSSESLPVDDARQP